MKVLLLAAVATVIVGCGKDAPGDAEPDASANNALLDMGSGAADVAVAESDVNSPSEDTSIADNGAADAAPPPGLTESEPNDGATLEDFDELPVGSQISGNIDASDADVFFVDAAPGTVYRVSLVSDRGSELQPHIAVFDAGRDQESAGSDYAKIVRGPQISFLAMGTGGYFIAVRDARTVDGAAAGGANFGYILRVESQTVAEIGKPLNFGSTLTGTLDGPGGVDLWTFDGAEGMNVRFDFAATRELDGRLLVFSSQEGSWIARQDDRSPGDPNPLLDAPLFASGPMVLVVESIAESATTLGYTIDAANP